MIKRFFITKKEAGRSLLNILRARLPNDWSQLHRLLREHLVYLNGKPCRNSQQRVRAGERIEVREVKVPRSKGLTPRPGGQGQRAKEERHAIVIRHVDEHVIVVDKPPGLTTMRHAEEAAEFGPRGKRFLPPTLADLLPGLLAKRGKTSPGQIRPVHRLDKETSGLVVFARTPAAESQLGKQFRAHSVERKYLALVRGQANPGRIESYLARDRGDGRRGSTMERMAGKRAVTNVSVIEQWQDYALVECRLETGRTHQIRIHLGEAGTPLCGETIYDRAIHGRPLPDKSAFPRPALHAASLGFEHPATHQRLAFTSPLPEDMAKWVARIRQDRRPTL